MYECPITKPVRTSEPSFENEPITLDEAKGQLELPTDLTHHDEKLKGLIVGAREAVEIETGIVCATGTFTLKMTEFPCSDYFPLQGLRPVSSVTSIVVIDSAGSTTTWSSGDYSLDTSTVVPIVKLGYGKSWPTIRGDLNGITITVVAGYATPSVVPQSVKQLVLLELTRQWNDREGKDAPGEGFQRVLNRNLRATYP